MNIIQLKKLLKKLGRFIYNDLPKLHGLNFLLLLDKDTIFLNFSCFLTQHLCGTRLQILIRDIKA